MGYAGLCFWITFETQNSVKDQIDGKLTLKWEQNIKWVNGMTAKDIKPSSSYPQIFYTTAKKEKKSNENKKRIYIYISIICISYLYINNSYN